jgi:hypothetical protein
VAYEMSESVSTVCPRGSAETDSPFTSSRKGAGPGAWTRQQEKELLKLFEEGYSIEALAEKFGKSPAAVKKKLQRLGVDIVAAKIEITGPLEIPKELPSLEEVLLLLAGALKKAAEPGLGKTELQRLAVIGDLYKAYADGLERYVGYRKIEQKLSEMEKKYAELAKKAQAQSV